VGSRLASFDRGADGEVARRLTTSSSVAHLEAYANGTRRNDVYGRMRDISRKLTPEEREQLARYFEGTL
jgi:hypothetical protein